MVTRTAERLLVSEGELNDAIGIVEAVLREQSIVADIEVTLYIDPEDPEIPEQNLIVARVRRPVDVEVLVDLVPLLAERLSASGLITPAVPLMFDISPEW